MMMHPSYYVVFGHAAVAVILGWLYFRRFRVTRPPIGVFNRADTLVIIAAIVVVPYVYLVLPILLATMLLGLGTVSVLYFAWEPVMRARWAIWLATLTLVAADVASAFLNGTTSQPFLIVNNFALLVAVVGVANLWAQSGMAARDVALLAAALTVYDVVATTQASVMLDLVNRLGDLPFAPLVGWDLDRPEVGLALGLGDLLVATLFPLVMRKAFGRTAGSVAMGSVLATIGAMLALLDFRILGDAVPAMIALGPVMLLQYAGWARRRERTTRHYLAAEPPGDRSRGWPGVRPATGPRP
jgi:hypothetical protein